MDEAEVRELLRVAYLEIDTCGTVATEWVSGRLIALLELTWPRSAAS